MSAQQERSFSYACSRDGSFSREVDRPQLLVEAITAIETAQKRFPNLGWEGFYPIKTWRDEASTPDWARGFTRDGWRQKPRSNVAEFPEQVATSIEFLRLCHATKSAFQGVNAYGLKHDIEEWGEKVGMSRYVPAGAAIIAALHLGFPVQTQKKETLPDYHPRSLMNDVVWIGVGSTKGTR